MPNYKPELDDKSSPITDEPISTPTDASSTYPEASSTPLTQTDMDRRASDVVRSILKQIPTPSIDWRPLFQ